jgi:hypothetical protein
MSTKQTIDMTNFDFGFTAMTEDELSVVQESKAQVEASSATAESASAKAQIMYEAVIPLSRLTQKKIISTGPTVTRNLTLLQISYIKF